MEYFPPLVENGKIIVRPPLDVIILGNSIWESSLVGSFVDKRLPFPLVKRITRNLWNHKGFMNMWVNDKCYFISKFANREDALNVLVEGPWMIQCKPILLRLWNPDLETHFENPKSIPLWVHFFDIPMQCWTVKGLSHIASGIGKPLSMDSVTREMCERQNGRCNYARVLVEVDASLGLPDSLSVWIPNENLSEPREVDVKIEYQWRPTWCPVCRVFGHELTRCPVKTRVEIEKSRTVVVQPPPVVDEEGFQTVTRRRKGKAIANDPVRVSSTPHTIPPQSSQM